MAFPAIVADEVNGLDFDPEDLKAPRGHRNYPSADEFADNIKATFREEKELGMVLGRYTREEAAEACRCTETELCPVPRPYGGH